MDGEGELFGSQASLSSLLHGQALQGDTGLPPAPGGWGSQPDVRAVFACCWGWRERAGDGCPAPASGSHPAGGGWRTCSACDRSVGRSAGEASPQDRAGCGILEKRTGHWQEAGGRGLKVRVTWPCRPCPLKLPDPMHSTPRGWPPLGSPSLSRRLRCQPSGATEVPLASQDTCHPSLHQRPWGLRPRPEHLLSRDLSQLPGERPHGLSHRVRAVLSVVTCHSGALLP